MKISNISKLFNGGGIILQNQDHKDLKKINKNKIIKLFKEYGIIIFRNYKFDPKKITALTDLFTHRYANDARRREMRFNNKKINTVDTGNKRMALHSEASFSPSWPEILWFVCIKPSKISGFTTFCDGTKVYENLSLNTKKFFLKNQVMFELKIPFESNGLKKKLSKNNSLSKMKDWLLHAPGTFDTSINLKEGYIYTKYLKYVVNETRKPGVLSFCNHLLAVFGTDPQILSCKLLNGNRIPKKIYDEINKITKKLTIEFKWKKNDICMIDNQRFMHGRTKIITSEKREILNIQTLYSNFE